MKEGEREGGRRERRNEGQREEGERGGGREKRREEEERGGREGRREREGGRIKSVEISTPSLQKSFVKGKENSLAVIKDEDDGIEDSIMETK